MLIFSCFKTFRILAEHKRPHPFLVLSVCSIFSLLETPVFSSQYYCSNLKHKFQEALLEDNFYSHKNHRPHSYTTLQRGNFSCANVHMAPDRTSQRVHQSINFQGFVSLCFLGVRGAGVVCCLFWLCFHWRQGLSLVQAIPEVTI